MFVRTYFAEVRYPEIVNSAPKHPFCNFVHANGSEMLQNTPKLHLWSIGEVCSCEHILRKFGTPKQCIRRRNTHLATFSMQTVAKWSKSLPNIVCGLLETIGCVCANIFYGSSVPRNSAFGSDTPVVQLFPCKRWRNSPNHTQTSFEV